MWFYGTIFIRIFISLQLIFRFLSGMSPVMKDLDI